MRTGRIDHLIRIVAAQHGVWPAELVGPAPRGPLERGRVIRRARLELAERARLELCMAEGEIAKELGISRESLVNLGRRARSPLPAPRGERCGAAKLTDEQAEEIRLAVNLPLAELAERYGVSDSTISRIRRGKRRGPEGAGHDRES